VADLVIVGDCNPDVMVLTGDITPAFGQQEQLVPAISLVVGGSAAITAVAAARLGARVELVAAIGDDAAGQFMLAELRRAGVGTGHVVVRGDLPTGMSVALSRGGDRAILTAPGGIATLTADDIPAGLLAGARHVHLSSYFLMEERLAPGLPAVFAAARAAGAVTSLDTNWDPSGRWGGARLREVLAQTELLLPNEAEALRIAGAATLDEAVATLTAGGASVAVKRGGDGAILVAGGVRYQATLPATRVVDTTGAGDCFNAGLITALLAGRGPADALALACAAGTGSTSAVGGTAGCPDLPAALALARDVTVHPFEPLVPDADSDLSGLTRQAAAGIRAVVRHAFDDPVAEDVGFLSVSVTWKAPRVPGRSVGSDRGRCE